MTASLLPPTKPSLMAGYESVRRFTERLCEPLETEDYVVQSMPDVSPTKWHLAHTSWFFETFVLQREVDGYRPLDDRFAVLFNSYYDTVGDQHPRPRRGLLSRPTVDEVFKYRRHVDRHMGELLAEASDEWVERLSTVLEVGLNHEQQHQELLLTDIKHVLAGNPLRSAYRTDGRERPRRDARASSWVDFEGGRLEIGTSSEGFAFDNERPRHEVLLRPYQLSKRLVTAADYLAFIDAGGYERPELWLADGWQTKSVEGWSAPLYWHREGEEWHVATLDGPRAVEPSEPVCHVSYYEADAFATWSDARLPLEAEWELATEGRDRRGNCVESGWLHPIASLEPQDGLEQLFGDAWEWTASAYAPYPGYRPYPGSLGEYNGKFMCNQQVLRGGSCATSRDHVRPTYRNFFYPHQRWQFTGIRLARSES